MRDCPPDQMVPQQGGADPHRESPAALLEADRADGETTVLREAVALDPCRAEAGIKLAACLKAMGEPAEAILHLQLALRAAPGDRSVGEALVRCLADLRLTRVPPALRDDLVAIVERVDLDLQPLAFPLASLVRASAAFAALESLAAEERAMPGLAGWLDAGLADLACDPLFLASLRSLVFRDAALERVLTAVRRMLLRERSAAAAVPDTLLPLTCALAGQCFLNEYAWFVGQDEERELPALVERAGQSGPERASSIALLACYRPLAALPSAHSLARFARGLEERGLARLVKQQVTDVERERLLARAIPCAGDIRDTVSKRVREQYEQNPYPRWLGSVGVADPEPLAGMLRRLVPEPALGHPLPGGPVDILCAGCGTGQQVVEKALGVAGARVLGVDLSRASLGYARRRALELGAQSAEFLHADILDLACLDRRFDLIESIGVLHHLADPEAGLRSLAALLKPGGLMRIGLYSRRARAGIAAAQALLRARSYGPSDESMRACRRYVLGQPPDSALGRLTNIVDFYALSEFRDLLFHANEHAFDLAEIAAIIGRLGLSFVGLELPCSLTRRYREMFGNAADLGSLDCWDRFERARPESFLSLYRFWLQAPA